MPARTRKARLLGLAAGVAALPGLVLTTAGSAAAAPGSPTGARPVPVPDSVKAAGIDKAGSLAPALRNAKGTVTVSVALSEKPVGASVSEDALVTGSMPSKTSQQAQTATVKAQQDRVIGEARGLGAKALGRASRAANVVAMSVAASKLTALAKIPGVVSVKPVGRYETRQDPGGSGSLAQAADYIEATAVRNQGYDGTGVRVAVLDSGVDYTHEYLGGPGTVEAYNTCYYGNAAGDPDQQAYNAAPTGACAALFGPTAPKIKGGYDFVGETWPVTPAEAPDPNPIDFEGHGTHVSDIVGGRSADGTHKGIAPGVDLYAVKVCSAVSTSCSGVAILQGIDWALDPNGDGDISDAVDIVNLSLGSPYGQEQDDSSVALDNLVRAGVVAVTSAGNNADRPFIVGSPSTAARVISVAQTALPDDVLYTIATSAGEVRNSKRQSWSPAPTAVITAPLAQPSPLTGCTAADFAGFPAGAIALIQRGACDATPEGVQRAGRRRGRGDHLEQRARRPAGLLLRRRRPRHGADADHLAGRRPAAVRGGGGGPGHGHHRPGGDHVAAQHHGRHLQPRSGDLRPPAEAGHRRPGRVAVGRGRHRQRADQLRRHLRRGSGRDRCGGPDPGQADESRRPW